MVVGRCGVISLSKLQRASSSYKSNGLAIYEKELAGHGGMSDGQRAFHESDHQRRLILAGNQIGKSRSLAAEAWWFSMGRHPFREVTEGPTLGWAMVADLKGGWANFSAKLKEIQPPNTVHPRCFYDGVRGYTRGGSKVLELRNGSLLVGKSGSQEQISLAGGTIDYGLIDELPKVGHFSEFRSRLAVRSAPCAMVFTPVGRPAEWLRNWVEGDPDTGSPAQEEWDITRIKLTPDNCPHRSPESIAEQIAGYGPWEYAQRVEGAWSGITQERWITGFGEHNLFDEPPTGIVSLGLGMDHGERPDSTVAYVVAWDGTVLWVLAEYKPKEMTTPLAQAREMTDKMAEWGIKPAQLEFCRGDSNSAGRLGLGFSINQLLERGFADVCGTKQPPVSIEVPYKGAGSVKARARMISNACVEGTLRIHNSCHALIGSLRHWRGESGGDFKHQFDAMGYVAECYLGQTFKGVGHMLIT